jgi:hypothetical protein
MNKKIIYSLVGLALIFFVTSLIIFLKSVGDSNERSVIPLKTKSGIENRDMIVLDVKAFFFTESSRLMKPVDLKFEVPPMKEAAYQRFLELLFKGEPGLISPIPEGLKIRSLFFVSKQGMLVLDFSEELITQFPGGTDAELEFIYFIVDNICYNFKEVQKVKFLVSGNESQTISGHIDLESPFYPDYQYLNINE